MKKKLIICCTLSVLFYGCLTTSTDLYQAIYNDEPDLEVFRDLVNESSVQVRLHETTPFLLALGHNYPPEIIALFIEAGADTNAMNQHGRSALDLALQYKSTENLKLLIDAGADLALLQDEELLRIADHKPKHFITLLEAGLDITAMGDALVLQSEESDVLQALYKAGADIDARDEDGNTRLILAGYIERDLELVQTLLDLGADPDILNSNGITPLQYECGRNRDISKEHTEILLNASADPNIRSKYGDTALTRAINHHDADLEIIRMLLEAGADVNLADGEKRPPLFYALNNQSPEAVRMLIETGADISWKTTTNGTTMLMHALRKKNNIDTIKLLVEHGADINATTEGENNTVLMYAARYHPDPEVLHYLIQSGAKVSQKNSNGETAFLWAMQFNTEKVARILGDPEKQDADNLSETDYEKTKPAGAVNGRIISILDAAFADHISEVTRLLDEGADPNLRVDGETPLTRAVLLNADTEIIRVLLEAGADVNMPDGKGQPPLLIALNNKSSEILQMLTEYGAVLGTEKLLEFAAQEPAKLITLLHAGLDVSAQVDDLFRYLFTRNRDFIKHAVSTMLNSGQVSDPSIPVESIAFPHAEDQEIIRLLLEAGADANIPVGDGFFPLHIALYSQSHELVKLLLEYGADLNAVTNENNTALMYAVKNCTDPELIRFLIRNGSDINHMNDYRETPLHWAAQYNTAEIVKVLIEEGARLDTFAFRIGTPYTAAGSTDKEEKRKILSAAGADNSIQYPGNYYAVVRALKNMDFETVDSMITVNRTFDYNDGCDEVLRLLMYLQDTNRARLLLKQTNYLSDYGREVAAQIFDAEEYAALLAIHEKGWTPNEKISSLLKAAESGNRLEVAKALKEGVYINEHDEYKRTALMYAAEGGQTEVVELLVSNGAETDSADISDQTALHLAAASGHLESVKLLADSGANINSQTSQQVTPLLLAVYYGHADVVSFLINAGADIDTTDVNGYSALMHTAEKGNTEIAAKLLAAGANMDVRTKYGSTVLMLAAETGHPGILELLISKGADLHTANEMGNTALQLASAYGENGCVSALLQAGSDPNLQTRSGKGDTALMSAAWFGYPETIKLLLAAGADPELRDGFGRTALSVAAGKGDKATVALLLRSGADMHTVDIENRTPLMAAVMYGHPEMIQLLISEGADLNAADRNGNTALHIASQYSANGTIEILLQAGADGTIRNNEGKTYDEVTGDNVSGEGA